MLQALNVSASYGKKPVLRDVSVRFEQRRLTALVGPNGCGKSTLLKSIMGFVPNLEGNVTIDGQEISRLGRRAMARRIAYLPQESHCPDYMTLGELVELAGYARLSLVGGPNDRDRALFREALETVGLTDLAHRRMNALSGGQRQRAWIAMVLAQDADIILMDEPVNHLDVTYQYSILELVRKLTHQSGKTIVTVLHDLNLSACFADDVILMKDGQVIAAGTMRQTLTRENVETVFAIKTDIFERDGRLVLLPGASPQAPVALSPKTVASA